MSDEIRTEIDRAKMNLDRLADALDRVATDPELRTRLATLPIETLLELGFDFDDETRQEILKAIKDESKGLEEWVGIWSASAVKSGIRSGVKVGVTTGVSTAVKSGVVTGVKAVFVEEPGKPGEPSAAGQKPGSEKKQKPVQKKGGGKNKE